MQQDAPPHQGGDGIQQQEEIEKTDQPGVAWPD
jgi:hypothetical protein